MTSALILLDRALKRLREMQDTGNVSEMNLIIFELDSAGEIIVSSMEKRGCLNCSPIGRIAK
jgi:hypothetical protein